VLIAKAAKFVIVADAELTVVDTAQVELTCQGIRAHGHSLPEVGGNKLRGGLEALDRTMPNLQTTREREKGCWSVCIY
jgi:hypothetical protein